MGVSVKDIDGLRALITDEWSDWTAPVEVTQEMINTFADVTKDHQWIHVDIEKAEAGPFGCLLYTSPSPRDRQKSRMPSSA